MQRFSELIEKLKARPLVAAGILAGVLVVLGAAVFIATSRQTSTSSSVQNGTTPQANVTEEPINAKTRNPFVNKRDLDAIRDALLKNNPKAVQDNSKFQYQLGSKFKKPQTFIPFVNPVYAASVCNLDTLGTTVTVYGLANHIQEKTASDEAHKWGIDAKAASLPSSTDTFQYFFATATNDKFFSQYESSGAYTYHQADIPTPTTSAVAPPNIQAKIVDTLTQHGLLDAVTVPNIGLNGQYYEFTYKKNLATFKTVDVSSVKALGANSICNVSTANEMGYVEGVAHLDGAVAKVINNTRKIIKTATVPVESIDKSLAEYGDNPPIPPIVIPEGKTKSGTVTINDAVVVYYDMGIDVPQAAYVPVYLTSGTVTATDGSTVRVITAFPVVSVEELDKGGFISHESSTSDANSQKQGTFKIDPPPPAAASNGGGCPGKLVDIRVVCTRPGGGTICSDFVSIPETADTNGICSSGCKKIDASTLPASFHTRCSNAMQDTNNTCTFNACPC